MQTVPARDHKRRRGQSEQYHRRVSKKWLKRFGRKEIPCAYKLHDGTMVVHPTIYAELRKLRYDHPRY